MKEAFGGIFNIIFVVIFLVVVIGVLGLVFSYTKAFKMKSAVISIIERYEGSGCYPEITNGTKDSACRRRIIEEAKSINYSPVHLNCDEACSMDGGMCNGADIYCYKMSTTKVVNGEEYAVFTVVTQVDISFPIIERIMGMRFFQVSGDTREIHLQRKGDGS